MPAVSSVGRTGVSNIDGVLSGVKWATGTLTFSFPSSASFYGSGYPNGETSTNFEAFTALQQAQTRKVLNMVSAVTKMSFVEVTESHTVHGDLRYAESDAPGTAWGYYPTTSAAGGDMWFNNSKNWYDNPLTGTYGYLTIMHETGHALGLKHAHEASGGFSAMPLNQDSLEYSVMSYRSYVGGPATGYTVGSTSFPQTLMMNDIAALQHMYGANYTTNSGDTVYRWNPSTGEMSINSVGQGAPAGNKVFMTVWDGGGNDTYDFSNYSSAMTVRLDPGAWSTISTVQLASLGGGKYAAGNIANALLHQGNMASMIENAIGGSGADSLIGNALDNRLTGNGGNDTLDGGNGIDTAVYSGLKSNYSLTKKNDGSWTITDLRSGSPDGTDTLKNMELVQFADGIHSLGTTPLPVNSAPVMTSLAPVVTLTEWTDNSAAEAANTPHTASGSLTFIDADVLDTHTAAFAARAAGYLGSFSLDTSEIAIDGMIGWSFSVPDSAVDYLAAGQTLTQYYDVTVSDGRGGTAMQTVTVNLTGTGDTVLVNTNSAPVMTSQAPVVTLTEWTDNSAAEKANTAHTASGSLTFSDADALDTHSASFAARDGGYLGTFSLNTSTINTNDKIGWSFSVSDSAMDYLAAGQTLTQHYDVTVSDGRGGTAKQTVTVKLTGTGDTVLGNTNSAPVFKSAVPTVTLTEWADNSAAESANTLHATSGSLTISDADVLDTHSASFAARASGYLGSFSLNTSTLNTNDKIDWSFSVSDSAMDFLAAGQTLTQYYDVSVNDGRGGTAKQTVTVKLVGTGDSDFVPGKPIAFDDVYTVGKNNRLKTFSPSGVLRNDVDSDSTKLKGILVSKPEHGSLQFNSDGSFSYRPDRNYVGQDSFTYKTSDGKNVSDVAKVWIGVGTSVVMGAGLAEHGDHGSEHGDHSFPDQIPMPFAEPDSQGLLGVQGLLSQLTFMAG